MDGDQIKTLKMTTETNKVTYGLELSTYDEYIANCKKSHKRAARKGERDGYQFKIKQVEKSDIEPGSYFRALYKETMDNLDASRYYYFNDEYFNYLSDIPGMYISYTMDKNGETIGAVLFMKYKNMLHYHLSSKKNGSKNVSDYIINKTIEWCLNSNTGITFVHFGGGIKNGDSLSKFKSSICNISFDYYCGKSIIDQEMYDILTERRAKDKNQSVEELRNSNYFPSYRA